MTLHQYPHPMLKTRAAEVLIPFDDESENTSRARVAMSLLMNNLLDRHTSMITHNMLATSGVPLRIILFRGNNSFLMPSFLINPEIVFFDGVEKVFTEIEPTFGELAIDTRRYTKIRIRYNSGMSAYTYETSLEGQDAADLQRGMALLEGRHVLDEPFVKAERTTYFRRYKQKSNYRKRCA